MNTNAGAGPAQVLDRQVDAVVVRVGVHPVGEALTVEDVPDLADPNTGTPAPTNASSTVGPGAGTGQITSLGAPDERPGLTLERPSDHPSDAVRANQQAPGDPAPLVELFEADHRLVARDLEHRVPARVHDR